ncbi:MAG TPA: hypothetical protein VMV98_01235 [Acidobacteriaceae bacterium]|nr:hypothetical protein [Acidobacteriaceae bacterium]
MVRIRERVVLSEMFGVEEARALLRALAASPYTGHEHQLWLNMLAADLSDSACKHAIANIVLPELEADVDEEINRRAKEMIEKLLDDIRSYSYRW